MKRSLLLIVVIIFVSTLPRIWQLNKYPPVIVDEAANLRDINKLLSYSNLHPFDYEWGYGQATLVHYPTISLITLGLNQFLALRLTSVILSLLALIPFFFIVKKYSNTLIAFCITLMFSFSYYYLQFSRVGWTNIHSLVLGLFLIWFIDLAIKKNSLLITAISGFIAGLLMYLYRSGEIYILAALLFLFLELIKTKSAQRGIKKMGIFLIFFIATSLPWIDKILSNWQLYNLRANVVSIFNVNLPYHNLYKPAGIISYQIFSTLKSWILLLPSNGGNIEDPRYLPLNHSIVSPPIALLFLAGLIISIVNFKKTYIWIFIFLTGLLFSQILTVDPPNGSRGLILLPIIYLFSALSLNLIYNKFKDTKFITPALIAFSVIISCVDFLFYQNWMTWIKV